MVAVDTAQAAVEAMHIAVAAVAVDMVLEEMAKQYMMIPTALPMRVPVDTVQVAAVEIIMLEALAAPA